MGIFIGHEALNAFEPTAYTIEHSFLSYALQDGEPIARNVMTAHGALVLNDAVFPVTTNDYERDNCYVVSPYAAYVDYARDELESWKSNVPKWPFNLLIGLVTPILRLARVDDAAHINNWLLSTNLYPQWDAENLNELTSDLITRFPDKFIYFRSLNQFSNETLMNRFVEAGYRLLPARQVYIFDVPPSGWDQKTNTRRDLQLIEKTKLAFVGHNEFGDNDFDRIRELYDALYLKKYTPLNPQFTSTFLRWAHSKEVFHFEGYRDASGVLVAVVGTFALGGSITAPIVGYDTEQPQSLGLYRMLMALVFKRAIAVGAPLNLSAGAASFKRLRGGVPYIEYSAVYDRHLQPHRRLVVSTLRALLNGFGVPIMRRYEL